MISDPPRAAPPWWSRLLGALVLIAGVLGAFAYPLLVAVLSFMGTPGTEDVMLWVVVGGGMGFGASLFTASSAVLAIGDWRLAQAWAALVLGVVVFIEAGLVLGLAMVVRGMAWH